MPTTQTNVYIHTFRRSWCFIWGCFFPVSIFKLNPDPSASFHYKGKAKNRPWNTLNMWSEFAEIEGIFFRINYEIRGRHCWKQQISSYKFKRSVSMTKDKTKEKTYEEKGWWRIPSRKVRSLWMLGKKSLEPKFILFD